MARWYARIRTEIGRDDDFRSLSPTAQWVYLRLLCEQKLTLVGSLDIKRSAWRRWASTSFDLDGALDELKSARFIALDDDTEELAIRTFVTHDDVLKNRNLGRGMWSAWRAIESSELREFVLENLPDEAWEPRFDPPTDVPFPC